MSTTSIHLFNSTKIITLKYKANTETEPRERKAIRRRKTERKDKTQRRIERNNAEKRDERELKKKYYCTYGLLTLKVA